MTKTVLVVDDSQMQCEALKEILESAGVRTVTACNADDAFALMESEKPSVALFDLILGDGENGVDLYKALHEKYPKLKGIIYTGYGPEEEVRLIVDAIHEGMIDEFLRKPMAPEEVVDAVKKHL
jgi:DNA-binding NtrC family response regulator